MQKAGKIFAFNRPEKDGKAVNLYIYGAIPDIDWENFTLINTANDFVKEFKALEDEFDRINIRINSPGGYVFEGLPIFNTIRHSSAEIHTYNEGLAASMGAVILMAGQKVHAYKNSLVMLHNSWGFVMGNAQEMREAAEMSDKVDEVLIQAFADKMGQDIEDVKAKFFDYKDHWLTATDAIEAGLVDTIEEVEAKVPEDAQNMSLKELLASLEHPKQATKPNSNIMSLKKWFSSDKTGAGNGNTTVSEAELSELKADMKAAQEQLDAATAEVTTLKDQLNTSKTEAATAKQELQAEKDAHQATQAAFDAFKEEAADTHTAVNHTTDPTPTTPTKPLSAHKRKEQEVRERAGMAAQKKSED